MTSKIKLVAVLAVSLWTAFAHADPPARAGRLNYLHGTVSLAPAASPDAWAVAVLNRPLTTGDRLWTDRDGYAEFHVGSTAVRLAPRTNADVLTLDDDTLQLRLAQGDINVRVRDAAENTIEIDTPNGAVLLEEAGSYRISTDTSGDMTSVIVRFGRAHVLGQSGSFSVRAGQHVSLRGAEGTPSEFSAASMDAFDRWSAELDRREDEIASTRYVSPHMTGYEDLDAYGTWRTMPEYGAVWVPRVADGWAPYRYGHWVWVEPWGWTWIDDAPWGFAPFHYGRWVWLNGYWAWAPGPRVVRPVYAPALVAFVGGSSWSVSIGTGPAVGWFPLGWREPFFPWYRTSTVYVRNINVTHVKNITIYNNVTHVNYANQRVPRAVTVVPREAFVSARPVARSAVNIPPGHAARAPLLRSSPAEPSRSSFVPRRAESRPPEVVAQREVFATRSPRARLVQGDDATVTRAPRGESERAASVPRVRVIERQRAEVDTRLRERAPVESPPRATAPVVPAPRAAPDAPRQPDSRAQPRPAPQVQQEANRREPKNDESSVQREERRSTERPREVRPPEARSPQPDVRPAPGQPQQQGRPDTNRDRRVAPAPRPQAGADRSPRAEREPRTAPQEQDVAPRSAPQPRIPREADAPRERRSPSSDNRPQPRAQAQPAPRAAARPEAAGVQRPPPEARASPPPRVQAPRPEARIPQHAPPPRAGGGRENREPRENRRQRD